MNRKLRGGHRRKRLLSRVLSLVLSAAMLVGGIGMSYTTPVYAETTVSDGDVVIDETVDTTVSEGDVVAPPNSTEENSVPEGDAIVSDVDTTVTENDTTVSENDVTVPEADTTVSEGDVAVMSLRPLATTTAFSGSATFNFGTDVTNATVFSAETGIGFSDIEYNTAAADWVGGVYYPRVASKDHEAGASYITNGDGYLTIASKAWTETESTGYGVYTYENTSSFDMVLDPADYTVSVTFVNPTDAEYTAYLESEDITKKSGIKVAAGAEVTESFTAVLVDGTLNLKFLAASSATTIDAAATQNVYVSKVYVAKQAMEEPGIKPTIFLASDSTVQTYGNDEFPKTGWGQTLHMFFGELVEERECEDCGFSQSQTYETESVIVENRAIGGRSSKSYIEEGKLDDLLEDVKPGDYLLVQWGHNDATAARPNRYVSSADFRPWIEYYVDGAIQRGATPVLVTPVARYSYSEKEQAFVGNFEQYGDVMRNLAAERDIAIVDLTQRSVALCNSFGVEGAKSLFMVHAGDSTHLQYYGAYKFAQCVAKGIQESGHASVADLATKVAMIIQDNIPGKINNLASTAVGSSSVSLEWDADEGAELYYVYRQVLTDGMTIDDVVFTNDTKHYSVFTTNAGADSDCESGISYVYAVRGFNEKGLGEFSEKILVTTKDADYKFDINTTYNGPQLTEDGWTGVLDNQKYDATLGYGWLTAPGSGRDRGEQLTHKNYNLMTRDCSLGAGEFAVDLPNGDYEITVYGGDLTSESTQKTGYLAEGISVGSISAKLDVTSTTGNVRVTDGQLNLSVVSAGNSLLYLNGFTITTIQKAPSELIGYEISVADTGLASYLISFVGVDEATAYRVYAKNSTDTKYNLVKEISLADYAEGPTVYGAMTGDAGEVYNVHVVAVLADGTETAPSNTAVVKTVLEGAQAEAPANLICTSPVEGATELQKSISLKWDEVDGAIKYIIYRSTRLEDEKGFEGFVKVGESKTTTFTDVDSKDNEVATNISYYYKVAALTVTGVGKLSEVCKTPVTGKMVAGARETYSDRALVAINLAGKDGGETLVTATDSEGNEYTKGVYLSWRSFEADFDAADNLTTTFDVYRNGSLIANDINVTNLIVEAGVASDTYKVVGSNDSTLGVNAKNTKVWANKYLELNLYCPDDATMPDGSTCTYEANDMSVGDLNGDGDLELIVKWYPSNAQDNSKGGYTGKTYLDGYDVDFATGEVSLMWRIDVGVNIRSGAHYTQFQVWDYDCDGKAEIAIKTADGTTTYKSTDGTLAGLVETGYVGACNTDVLPTNVISEKNDYRNTSGYVLDGPEYFSIFNGEDGTKAADDVEYLPGRGNVSAWGDGYGGRVDRFLSATAYLNGETPFAVFCRGYYTRTCLTAYYMKDTDGDGIGDAIDVYWEFDTDVDGTQYEAQGNHGLSVNDVDNDGRDEIIYGALVLDNDGTVLYSTGLGHGDAMHVSDWVSWNDGLEIMAVHEHDNAKYHVEIHDAETGEVIMGYYTGKDTGRGVAADIDPTAEGAEWWSIASPTYEGNDEPSWDSTDGEVYSSWSTLENLIKLADTTPAANASIFWDGDLLSEIQDLAFNKDAYAPIAVKIYDWNYETDKQEALLDSTEIWTVNGTKGNVGLAADILGDWREEIIARTSADKNVVRIYSTTITTDYVVPCLLENLAYREGVAWQNVGYNQPANVSYLLSEGLITAQIDEKTIETGSKYVQFDFSAANDSNLYGKEILGYEIYRAEGDGEFELHDSFRFDDGNTEGRESFVSATVEALTEVLILKQPEITVPDLVEGTPIAEGKTVADLLPAQVDVEDHNGDAQKAFVVWDASKVDINTVGTYEATATVEGWSDPITVSVNVVANAASGYVAIEDITIVETTAVTGLPKTVTVTYTNTTTKDVAVTWDTTTVDTKTVGEYVVYGTLEETITGLTDKPSVKVKVIADSITEVAVSYLEVTVNSTGLEAAMPTKATVTWASTKTTEENVTWDDLSVVKMDTVGTYTVSGKLNDFENAAEASVYVAYPAVYRFDFSIAAATTESGWTNILVNGKGGIKTAAELGSEYTSEKGYGFTNGTDVVAGRDDNYTYAGLIPQKVYRDYAMPQNQPFQVDLPNGTYYVEILAGCGLNGGNKVSAEVEGISNSVSSSGPSYNVGTWESVEVADGQLNITCTNSNCRTNAIIIRQIELAPGFSGINDQEVVVGATVTLPEKVTVVKSDQSTVEVGVTWDTSTLDVSKVGSYIVTGTLAETIEGLKEQPKVTVTVIEDYIVSTEKVYVEAEVGKDVAEAMPVAVKATYFSGAVKNDTVTWDLSKVDANTVATYAVTGTIEGSEAVVEASLYVAYPVVGRYDFSISATTTDDEWTNVVVNGKGGKKTMAELGSEYTAEKGYGFADGSAVFEGRDDNYTYEGLIPQKVYRDYAMPTGNTFLVDLADGTYYVELIVGCGLTGRNTVTAKVEGTEKTVNSNGPLYVIGTWDKVVVEDGQLNIEFVNNLCRTDGIVIRAIDVADKDDTEDTTDAITAVEKPFVEVEIGKKVASAMPATVTATYESGATAAVDVAWDVSNVDKTTVGLYTVQGTVEGYTGTVEATVYVAYPVVYKFDFGTKSNAASVLKEGFTLINEDSPSYEEKTSEAPYGLTAETKADLGFGCKYYSSAMTYPNTIYGSDYESVFNDGILAWLNTAKNQNGILEFKVDLPAGKYSVDVLTARIHSEKYSCENYIVIENEESVRIKNKLSADVTSAEVEVTDGTLNIKVIVDDAGYGAWLNGLVIREVVEAPVNIEDISYKFDFGTKSNAASVLKEGFTLINEDSPSYEDRTSEAPYGLTAETKADLGFGCKYYSSAMTYSSTVYGSDYESVFNDGILAWLNTAKNQNGILEFKVDLPAGKYSVDVLTARIHSEKYSCENYIVIENEESVRIKNKLSADVTSAEVEVTDGTLNIKVIVDDAGYGAWLNGLVIQGIGEVTTVASTNTVTNTVLLGQANALEVNTLTKTTDDIEESTLVESTDGTTYTYTDNEDVKSNTTYRYKVVAIVDGEEVIVDGIVPSTPSDDSSDDDDDSDSAPEATPAPEVKPVEKPVVKPTEKPAEKPAEEATPILKPVEGEGDEYKAFVSEVKAEIPASVMTDAVKEATGCGTVEELITYLQTAITESDFAGDILADVASEDTKAVDINILVTFDGGKNWVPATKENFPSDGMDVVIPYPEGTDKDTHDFVVGHMITTDWNGQIPGTMEYLNPTKTADGLKIHIMSASPFVIGWKEIAKAEQGETVTETPVTPEKPEQSTETQQTPTETVEEESGSNMSLILIILAVIVVGAVAIGVVVMRKKKEEE